MGRRMRAPFADKDRPAPRDSQTEKVNVLRPASFLLAACEYLYILLAGTLLIILERGKGSSPSVCKKTPLHAPKENVEKKLARGEMTTQR